MPPRSTSRRADLGVPPAKPIRRRKPHAAREAELLDAAANFFAEHGFEATTRALADQLGVTQALLYRYFPSKSVLIDRVFAERMSGGWDPAWSDLLVDRRLSLAERLTQFYTAYQGRVTETGMRLYLRAALQEAGNRRAATARR